MPLNLHFKGGRVKCEIGLAKGKKQHDKRDTERDRDWQAREGALDALAELERRLSDERAAPRTSNGHRRRTARASTKNGPHDLRAICFCSR